MEYGLHMKHLKVEIYLLEFSLYLYPKLKETVIKSFSHTNTVGKPY